MKPVRILAASLWLSLLTFSAGASAGFAGEGVQARAPQANGKGAAARKPACMPQVVGGWIRLLPNGMPMHAGFARIDNHCASPATIIAAKSAGYDSVELHETRNIDGMMRMRQLHELRIAPHQTATMKPGGLHLMLMAPKAPLHAGSRVAIVFTLADGRELVGEFIARKAD